MQGSKNDSKKNTVRTSQIASPEKLTTRLASSSRCTGRVEWVRQLHLGPSHSFGGWPKASNGPSAAATSARAAVLVLASSDEDEDDEDVDTLLLLPLRWFVLSLLLCSPLLLVPLLLEDPL